MPLLELLHRQLVPDKTNERVGELAADRYMGDLRQLAGSIKEHGLLQNLVITKRPRGTDGEEYFTVKAGERRWRSIGLLIAEGDWDPEKPIMCLLIEGTGWLQQAAENACRLDVPIWRQGHRFIEFSDGGIAANRICASIGKSPSYVSAAMTIARGLAPEIERMLDKLEPGAVPVNRLLSIARLVDTDTDAPDVDAQRVKLAEALGRGKRKRRSPAGSAVDPRERVWARYKNLRDGRMKSIGPKNQAIIEAVVAYLEGQTGKLRLPR